MNERRNTTPRQLTRDTARRLALGIALEHVRAANNMPEIAEHIVSWGPGVYDLDQAVAEVHKELNDLILDLKRHQGPLFERP